ncbi:MULTISPECIES: CopD family copper resistance protein [Bordetella]|uniref:Copper resistance protein D domain-containing protein n=1 Tax=Bordetella genomosp. 6 TaxID=463024 RepID=A0ABX4FD68_9BORD|nr:MULTISPECIES: membrane protein [Bordetella]AOB27121.1 hypothetical protein BBB44_13165 [Bordetella bronchiseptica]AWP75446.1 hypothetical protein B7P10_13690 [Bordetella bronchiseptica]AZW44434.1 hypothetical protein CWR61_13270 [Bordetella bronchiseptica]KCV60845.1 hypothetical protein L493_2390 [Bordetella bronchiseptica 99-R-0433]KDB97361.1 hypothetical protein AZ23_2588 [Bordetella bronchiseptica E010]
MTYPILLTLHLLAAFVFIGTVFFEVLILESVRKQVPREAMNAVERGIGNRARAIMPWVLLALFGAGVGMAWQHRGALAQPLASSFGLLLSLKIVLALSVLGHFAAAMRWRRRGELRGRRSRRLHLSVFCHVVAIVLLAKGMYYIDAFR